MIDPRLYIYYDHKKEENRVSVLQQMLRAIAHFSGDMALSVPISGNFDNSTQNAVRAFQRKYGLSENGTVDLETWDKIREVYTSYLLQNSAPDSIQPFFDPKSRLVFGDRGGLVTIVQIMLDALRLLYDAWGEIPLSGVYDDATGAAIRAFQRANILDATGETDVVTWNRLAAEYNYAIKDRQ